MLKKKDTLEINIHLCIIDSCLFCVNVCGGGGGGGFLRLVLPKYCPVMGVHAFPEVDLGCTDGKQGAVRTTTTTTIITPTIIRIRIINGFIAPSSTFIALRRFTHTQRYKFLNICVDTQTHS